jgi:hypothetical protein
MLLQRQQHQLLRRRRLHQLLRRRRLHQLLLKRRLQQQQQQLMRSQGQIALSALTPPLLLTA